MTECTIKELIAKLLQIHPPAFAAVEWVSIDGDREVLVASISREATNAEVKDPGQWMRDHEPLHLHLPR